MLEPSSNHIVTKILFFFRNTKKNTISWDSIYTSEISASFTPLSPYLSPYPNRTEPYRTVPNRTVPNRTVPYPYPYRTIPYQYRTRTVPYRTRTVPVPVSSVPVPYLTRTVLDSTVPVPVPVRNRHLTTIISLFLNLSLFYFQFKINFCKKYREKDFISLKILICYWKIYNLKEYWFLISI